MLSRAASSLYWMGRHIERSDFTARIIDAALKFDILPYSDGITGLRSAFEASGAVHLYDGETKDLDKNAILDFMLFDENNPSSIVSCFAKARHDARSVRTAVTREVFETLNEAWLIFPKKRKEGKKDVSSFLAWIEEIARGYDGAIQRTMLRSEPFWFARLGAAIERSDNTARLLDVKYHVLLPKEDRIGGPIDQAQWTALLRSVSAETAYRWLYREGLSSRNVADMLIFRDVMPRSLSACAYEINSLLGQMRAQSGVNGGADWQARQLQSKLSTTNIDSAIQYGLHEFLGEIIIDNNMLGLAIADQFMF
jgi:uncharacterized alpha-E superfamily protein